MRQAGGAYHPAGATRLLVFAGLVAALRADVPFGADVVSHFLEASEVPLTSIKQRGERIKGVREIERTDRSHASTRPIMHILTAPSCGACDMLKRAVNRGGKLRELMRRFDVVHLHGLRAKWTDKWHEAGHEAYVPQVYFYSRHGKPLNVLNPHMKPGEETHSFVDEGTLAEAMAAALERDSRIVAGEDIEKVLRIGKYNPIRMARLARRAKRQQQHPPPPHPPPPTPSATKLPASAPGAKAKAGPGAFLDCASCVAEGFGWSKRKGKCGGYANRHCPEL
jgi:hypothetical protein